MQNTTTYPGIFTGSGKLLYGYAALSPPDTTGKVTVTVRVGTSFISIDQARRNIDAEIPDHDTSKTEDSHLSRSQTLERTAQITRSAWAEKLNRFSLEGATEVQKDIFWTGVAHALQVKPLFCVLSTILILVSILQSNTKKDCTIPDTTAKYTRLMVKNHIPGILSGYTVFMFLHLNAYYLTSV